MATLVSIPRSQIALINPIALVRGMWRHRDLIALFTWREIEGRYRGSFLGLIWSLAHPLFMLAIYTFVFGLVLKARWPQATSEGLGEFALIVFAGLIAFNLFSECVTRASGLIIGVPNYVKKVVFPLEILPLSVLGAALFHLLVSLGVLVVAELLVVGHIPLTALLLPIVLLPAMFLSLGLMWFLASFGVFVRDIGQVVGLVVQALFFFTPIFYSSEIIPEPFRALMALNPMSQVVENVRQALLWNQLPQWDTLGLWLVVTGVIMMFGYAWFMKTKKAFADVI